MSRLPHNNAPSDAYNELLRNTRALRTEERAQRDAWFEELRVENKDEVLFELEVLLKASACFANPRNHPGPPKRTPRVAQDFREPLALAKDGYARAVVLTRHLLGERDKAYVFHRYLETVVFDDNTRARLLPALSAESPQASLLALRHGLSTATEVMEGLTRTPRLSFRQFYSTLNLVEREVHRNPFFNPLTALEFRPEFDRIRSSQVRELIAQVPTEQARRAVALTFLSLFRMTRYLELLSLGGFDVQSRKRHSRGRAYLVLSVLRSDARALSEYLGKRVGPLLASAYERRLLDASATALQEHAPALTDEGLQLANIKSALDAVAASLRLELRRAFQHDLPSPAAGVSEAELRSAISIATGNLRPALHNAVLFLARSLGVPLDEHGLFGSNAGDREGSERLRRDIWMFSQILRAFALKAQSTPALDEWHSSHDLRYVREFLAYFRAMGYPLLRSADYPRFDAFLEVMSKLRDTDMLDPARLNRAIDECTAFGSFLNELFERIAQRDVLADSPFDRRAAAHALKLYLGNATT